MSSIVSASQVVTGQVQSLDSVRAHALPSDAMIFASATKIQPANQNPGSFSLVESANALTLTTTGSVPVVTQSPFADLYKEGSIYFNGTVGNYVSATATGLMGTQWNTTGLTVEAWVNYPTFTGAALAGVGSGSYPYLVGSFQPAGTNYLWGLGANTSGYVSFYYYNGAAQNINATVPLSLNTWNHIAFSCLPGGATANVYVNGVSVATAAISGTPTISSSTPLTLGQLNSGSPSLNAYVADVRITTGAALYTGSSFTVPSVPLSPAATGVAQALIRAGANSPYIANGALTFDRGLKDFMNFGPMTFNIVTRGFTAIWRGAFTTPLQPGSRIFDFVNGSTQPATANNILVGYSGTGLYFYIMNGASFTTALNTSGLTITAGTTYVITAVYNPNVGGGTMSFWVNGLFNNSQANMAASIGSDRTLSFTGLGRSAYSTDPYSSMTSNTLAVYNRALSNVEILNAYSALTTNTVNAPIEIGDSNGTPALSIAGDGRVSVTQLGQTSNVVPWPPAAMTGYDTVINGQVYKARANGEYNSGNLAWYAFDKSLSTQWAGPGSYNTSSPYNYTGTVTTTDINGSIWPGDWYQIQLPNQVGLSSYSINPLTSTNAGPSKFVVLGSRDGVNWNLVDSRSGVSGYTNNTPTLFTLPTPSVQPYSYFRVVVQASNGSSLTVSGETVFYGTADTAQTLTVAQPMTLSYGAQTASLTGISGDKYVPQDFSSSGLNIPAYVVSNTATAANTVAFSSFGPFAGEGSVYFPGGTGAYVSFPGTGSPLNFNLFTTPWVFEAWIYLTTNATNIPIISRGQLTSDGTGQDWGIYAHINGIRARVNGTQSSTITTAVPLNSWNHISVVYNGSTISGFLNGVIGSAFSGFTTSYTSSYGIQIGSWGGQGVNFGMVGSSAYITNARIVSGQALYTTTFTPPTGPLQPIQGTTQAGLPYGTVLLLRNAPAPGRVLTSKFGGANSGQVLSFPPGPMTTYATTLNSGYGQGTYVASASSEYSGYGAAWQAFDKANGGGQNTWASAQTYNTTTGVYTGAVTTTDVNGNSYSGEWLQLQLPVSLILSSFTSTPQTNATSNSPYNFVLLGSRDGINWFLVFKISNFTAWTAAVGTSFAVTSAQAFSYFRLVGQQIQPSNSLLDIGELVFNGTIEGPSVSADGRLGLGVSNPVQALEVAGNSLFYGRVGIGTTSPVNTLSVNGSINLGAAYYATPTQTTKTGPYIVQAAGFDAVGTTHDIYYSSFAPNAGGANSDNFGGVMFIIGKNLSVTGKQAALTISLNKRSGFASFIQTIQNSTVGLTTFSVAVGGLYNSNVVVTSDSDMAITWTFISGA